MKQTIKIINAELIDEKVQFDLIELSQVCKVPAEILIEFVEYGIIEPIGSSPTDWLFDAINFKRSCQAVRLQHDLNLPSEALGIILDLLDEVKELRSKIYLLQQQGW